MLTMSNITAPAALIVLAPKRLAKQHYKHSADKLPKSEPLSII